MGVLVVDGNLFSSLCDVYVNPVNTEGVSGAGLAKEFAKRFPRENEVYRKACKENRLNVGEILAVRTETVFPETIVYFPTKDSWRYPSEIEYIAKGAVRLREWLVENEIESIAIPALGCGLGGLSFDTIRAILEGELKDLGCRVEIYRPTTQRKT